ncbi:hypothetical protein ACIBM3_32535 [Rhodococcus erythropolis]|uniref:hypothetical protein n=1 Tax=Rhodococcus erythropolis TaxID=1833 RepID=UPI0037B53001
MSQSMNLNESAKEAAPQGNRPLKEQLKLLFGALIMPLFFFVAMPGIYAAAFHSPAPHHMRVDVIGSDTQTSDLATGLSVKLGDSFDVAVSADVDAALLRLDTMQTRGAYDPSTGTLYVASAGNLAATNAVETVFKQVAEAADQDIVIEDVAPLPAADRLGTALMFMGLGAIVAGFLTTTVLNVAFPGLRIRDELGVLAIVSAVAAVVPMFIAYAVYGAFSGHIVGVALALAASCFVTGVFHGGGLRLIGPAMILVTVFLTIMLGIPASGAAIGIDMIPRFFSFLHPLLSTPASLESLKRILYFDGAGIGTNVVTLAMWALLGLALYGISLLMAHKEKSSPFSLDNDTTVSSGSPRNHETDFSSDALDALDENANPLTGARS